MEENFQQGVTALKAGNRAAARRFLGTVVRESPDHIQAWLWLSGAVDKDEERVYCLRQVLRIQPDHPAAARALAQILQKQNQAKPQLVSQPPVPPSPTTEKAEKPGSMHPDTESPNLAKAPSTPESAPQFQEKEDNPSPIRGTSFPTASPYHPNLRFMKTTVGDSTGHRVFRTRPSLVPTMIGFWLMVFIAWGMNAVLQENTQVELTLLLLNCGILGGIIVLLLIRLMLTHYELTSRQLMMSNGGKRTVIPVQHILEVILEQTWLQKIIRTGDIVVEASIGGELRQVRMRHLTDFQTKVSQILYLVQEQKQ